MSPVPYSTFRAALDGGNLKRVVELAREMPPMALDDALRVVLLMRDNEEDHYEAACVRWLGRFALEGHSVRIDDLQQAARSLDVLPTDPDGSMASLLALCVRRGVAGSTVA